MIVTCPACSSRYRIKEEKIRGRGAKISCPKCDHKFIVHRETDPAEDAKGVPVTFARGGKKIKKDLDEDDEADVPTTVMPHGSQTAQQIKAAAAAFNAPDPEPPPPPPPVRITAPAAPPRPAASVSVATDIEIPQDGNPTRQLRAKARSAPAPAPAEAGGGPPIALVVGGLLVLALVGVVAAKLAGVF